MTDRSDFEALFRANHDDLLRYSMRRLPDPVDAADVVAETFAVAWRRWHELPPADERRLWLFGVARRTVANHRRGQVRRSELVSRLREELIVHVQSEPEHDGHITLALSRLSARDRDLLVMVAWDELNTEEISVILGCSATAVRVRVHRARRRLRDALLVEGRVQRADMTAHIGELA